MSVLFGLGLLFLPYVLKRLPLPENVKTRRAALSLGLDLALLLGLLAVCCTHVDGDWFWITAVSVVYACSVLILPFVIRQLPLPGRLAEHRRRSGWAYAACCFSCFWARRGSTAAGTGSYCPVCPWRSTVWRCPGAFCSR